MSDKPDGQKSVLGLNPALKSTVETTHHTSVSSRAPVETASVQREEGRAWPAVWLVVAIVCAVIVVYLLLG